MTKITTTKVSDNLPGKVYTQNVLGQVGAVQRKVKKTSTGRWFCNKISQHVGRMLCFAMVSRGRVDMFKHFFGTSMDISFHSWSINSPWQTLIKRKSQDMLSINFPVNGEQILVISEIMKTS